MKLQSTELYPLLERRFKTVLFALLGFLFGTRSRFSKVAPESVQRCLVLRYDRIGDMIVTLPMIRYLKQINPSLRLDVLASASNAIIAESDPHVDSVHIFPDSLLQRLGLIFKLRKQRYDLVIACIFAKSTFIGLLGLLIGGKRSIRATKNRGEKYDVFYSVQSEEAQRRQPAFEKNVYIIPDVFDTEVRPDATPVMYIPEPVRQKVRAKLATAIGSGPEQRYALVNISVRTARNMWPDDSFCEVIRCLLGHRLHVIISSMPHDHSRADALLQQFEGQKVHTLNELKSVMEVAAVVDDAYVVISPDTAIVHMCSALHKPLVGLYVGDTAGIQEWGPYSIPHFEIVTSQNRAPVNTIPPYEVIVAVDHLLLRLDEAA